AVAGAGQKGLTAGLKDNEVAQLSVNTNSGVAGRPGIKRAVALTTQEQTPRGVVAPHFWFDAVQIATEYNVRVAVAVEITYRYGINRGKLCFQWERFQRQPSSTLIKQHRCFKNKRFKND